MITSIPQSTEPEPEPRHDRPEPRPEPGRPHQRHGELLMRMVREGDARAAAAGRTVPRTRAEMEARLTAARAADDACVLCGYWRCRCGTAAVNAGAGAAR